jgi:sugar lactone lactonase YvrE
VEAIRVQTLCRTISLAAVFFAGLAALPALVLASPPTATTEAAIAVSYEQATLRGTVNPEGSATTYWFEYGETTSYGTKVPLTPESVGSGTTNVSVSQSISGLSQSTTYHFRVLAEASGETVTGEDTSFTTAGFNFSFAEAGSGNGQLSEPFGVAADSKGNLWVSDTGNNRIEEFNEKGEYLFQFGKEGSGNGEFKAPKGIGVDTSGNIWVVDSGNNRVQEFDPEGKYLLQFGKEGAAEGQFKSPSGIVLSGSGPNIFVADTGNNRVQKFSPSGKWLATIGKGGSGDGELKSPTGVAIEATALWVADTGNNRVQKFNLVSFNFSRKFGEKGSGKGQFESPTGITTDLQGRLWVVDSGNGRVEKFNLEGEYQDQIGASGSGAGQFSNPMSALAPAQQKLVVVDTGNSRVERWTVKAEPPTIVARLASELKVGSAALNANIDPEALATAYWFEYGPTTAYGTKVPLTPESIGSGSSVVKVSQTVTGLSKETTYHFRAVAESSAGIVMGADKTFILIPPKAITEPASAVQATQATLNGKVNPEGSSTKYWFEYGKTTSYGVKIPLTPEAIGSGVNTLTVSQTPTGLSKGTEYHFRIAAENGVGTSWGEDKTFTTEP